MTKKIKLMLDYGCYPLWWYDSDKVGNIDPSTLPLSAETIHRLNAFTEANNSLLDWDNPANSEEANEAEIAQFEQEGIEIWQQLQKELFPEYQVVYFSEKLRKIVTNINELNSRDILKAHIQIEKARSITQSITRQQQMILKDLQSLSSEQQQNVLDFIHFLMTKNQAEQSENRQDDEEDISFYQATKEIAGSLDWGPGDLATNKKYLEDMGK